MQSPSKSPPFQRGDFFELTPFYRFNYPLKRGNGKCKGDRGTRRKDKHKTKKMCTLVQFVTKIKKESKIKRGEKMEQKIYSVTGLNKEVKRYIEGNPSFNGFYLKGEISNITYYKSGHLYFTLKDKNSSVKCASFQYKLKNIPTDLTEGESIKLQGKVSLYDRNGQYQIIVSMIEKENKLGLLYAKMEKLKKELSKKGFFDEENKQEIPFLPLTIGVVTSGSGAAVRDIINTARNRFENINIYVYPAKVQGDGACEEIKQGIEALNKIEEIDVIIAGRGGGSIEDLWAFNEEKVVKAFYNSKKPIVSAVGHEIDFLLTDFVADKRAATPTHSSEIIIPEKEELLLKLKEKKRKIKQLLSKKMEISKMQLNQRKDSYILKNYMNLIEDKNQLLMEKEEKLVEKLKKILKKNEHKLELMSGKLESLNPLKVLERGYSITTINKRVIKNIDEIKKDDIIETQLAKGKISSVVMSK